METRAPDEWAAPEFGAASGTRMLKSGCRIEARQLATATRLERCLTLFSVIAWRDLWVTLLARTLPDASVLRRPERLLSAGLLPSPPPPLATRLPPARPVG